MTAEVQHVRVTVDGEARPLSHCPELLRVRVGGHTILVDTRSPDVLVEYPEPPRVWRDGDVVARGQFVWSRTDGRWHAVGAFGVQTAYDADVDGMLVAGTVEVVRYQGGED